MKSCLGLLFILAILLAVVGGGGLIWYLSNTAEFSRKDGPVLVLPNTIPKATVPTPSSTPKANVVVPPNAPKAGVVIPENSPKALPVR